nr:unnamed protein product [Digitaria exilis]
MARKLPAEVNGAKSSREKWRVLILKRPFIFYGFSIRPSVPRLRQRPWDLVSVATAATPPPRPSAAPTSATPRRLSLPLPPPRRAFEVRRQGLDPGCGSGAPVDTPFAGDEREQDRARRLLAKPIKFYHEMEELFVGSSADGSLAMDQETCLNDDGNSSDNSESEWMNDTTCYAQHVDLAGDDSDTLPEIEGHKKGLFSTASGDDSSSSMPHAGKKRPRGKSPSKKPQKSRSRFAEATKEINTTMKAIVQALAEPPPPPPLPTPHPGGAHASLWKKIEALPITTEDKVSIGVYLARPEQEGMRDFLSASSDNTLETWVYKFLCTGDGH